MGDLRRALALTSLLSAFGCSKATPVDTDSSAREAGAKPRDNGVSAVKIGRLRWDASEHPVGLLRLEPRLEWQLGSQERGQQQTAYQVLVASDAAVLASGKPDVWDSGKVSGQDSINVAYRGPDLLARQRGVWTVRVWDKQDRPSAYATPANWDVGPWDEEVEGDWIGRASTPGESITERERSVTYFRRAFVVPPGFKEAKLYATAFGLYEASVNGQLVTDDVLAPGFTDYEKRVLVQARDVTSLIHAGDNVVAGVLAGGWCTARFRGQVGRCGTEPPRLRMTLEVTLPDGKLQTIESDDEWKYAAGPLQSAQLFEGESYDARREMPGWNAPGFDDRAWLPAVEYDGDTERNVYPDPGVPIRAAQAVPALTVAEPSAGGYVFDLGHSIVGWARTAVQVPAGTNVTLRYAEELRPDGTLLLDARAPSATDHYVARGSGLETWEPRFSLRKFRYVEVRGLRERPTLDTVVGRPVRSDTPLTGNLQTSDEALNRFFASILAQQDRAFLSVPSLGQSFTSQPGSLLEAQVFALTACLNRDVQRFYRKWLDDIRDTQLPGAGYAEAAPIGTGRDSGPAGAAGILVPWAMYRCYGDRTGIDAHITSMGRWVDGAVAKSTDMVWKKGLGAGSADPLETGPSTDPTLLATAELAYAADALAQMLRSGGAAQAEESERFQKLARAGRAAFKAEFVLPDGKLKSDTQTAYALAIARGVLDPEAEARAGRYLAAAIERAQGHTTTGTLGTALLLPALSRVGRIDLAYALLHGLAEPNANLPRGLELGALAEWMYDAIGGIALDPAAPAGRHVLVRPKPYGTLNHARASFASLYGPITTAWSVEGGVFRLKVALPVGSTATVWMPNRGAVSEGNTAAEKSNGVTSLTPRETGSVLELASGNYEFSVAVP